MSCAILKYKKQIQSLNPAVDSSFYYDSIRWTNLSEKAKKLVAHYENQVINRQDVIKAFKTYKNTKENYLQPFIMTMIWGFADTGYGTYRTNNYIKSKENRKNIKSALDDIYLGNIKQAFNTFMKINGLNVSYVSKLLYFGTKATERNDYALIFDIRVARALVKVLDSEGISELLNITPSTKYKDYDNYNKLIHRWAKELNVEAENIEMFLFNGDF